MASRPSSASGPATTRGAAASRWRTNWRTGSTRRAAVPGHGLGDAAASRAAAAAAAAIEAAADEFASQLVLPDYMVEPWLQGRRVDLALAVALAATFRASITASAIKLARRPGSGVCLVCHSLQGRRWFVRSGNWPPRLYPALQLHPDTAAFRLAARSSSALAHARASPGAHWLSGMASAAVQVDAQSLRLPDGAVLTMLAMPAAARRGPPRNRVEPTCAGAKIIAPWTTS